MPAAKKLRTLSVEDVIDLDDLPSEVVPTPEWGEGTGVEVRALSRMEVVRLVEACTDDETGSFDNAKYQLTLVMKGWGVTEDRYTQLERKHTTPIRRIADKVAELSGVSENRFQLPD